MSLRAALERIMREGPAARASAYAKHPLAQFIRDDAAGEVRNALANARGLLVKGSAGSGIWAAVPWIGVFDEVVTDTATRGYYVVYLFHTYEPIVHLSLNQGATATRAEFKRNTRAVLADRAALMRRRLEDFQDRLSISAIDLGSDADLPGDYAAGHALGLTYTAENLPADDVLALHLSIAVSSYRALTFRGALNPSPESDSEDDVPAGSLTEQRRYRMHRRIERNPRAAIEAKRHHGTRCQGCDLLFSERYGQIGEGFIEAHHLRPISSLEEGVSVSYDVATDFAVLCSNCHRMIHKTTDPSDLHNFRQLIRR